MVAILGFGSSKFPKAAKLREALLFLPESNRKQPADSTLYRLWNFEQAKSPFGFVDTTGQEG